MKKYVAMMLIVLLTMSAPMGLADNRTCAALTAAPGNRPDPSFSEEEYQKLLALQEDGYRRMTLSAFRRRVAILTDSEEYRDLLERFSQSEILYALRDTHETAAFLFYELPLAGEDWRTRRYGGEAVSSLRTDAARLEYAFTMTVLNADAVMLKDYDDLRLGIVDAMQSLLVNMTAEELSDGAAMRAYIQSYVDALLPDLNTPEVRVEIEFKYFPLPAEEEGQDSACRDSGWQEARRTPHGTQEDYRSLLSLNTPDVRRMALGDFQAALLEWTNGHRESMERIDEDIARDEIEVSLTDEERAFVKRTVWLSGMENGRAIQSQRIGRPCRPYVEGELSHHFANGAAWCRLRYRFSYSILDAGRVTVGERDRQIESMIQAIGAFWNDAGMENLLSMGESDVLQALQGLAQACSTAQITMTIEQAHFERMDERALADERIRAQR